MGYIGNLRALSGNVAGMLRIRHNVSFKGANQAEEWIENNLKAIKESGGVNRRAFKDLHSLADNIGIDIIILEDVINTEIDELEDDDDFACELKQGGSIPHKTWGNPHLDVIFGCCVKAKTMEHGGSIGRGDYEKMRITHGEEEIHDLRGMPKSAFVKQFPEGRDIFFLKDGKYAIVTKRTSNLVMHGKDAQKSMKLNNVLSVISNYDGIERTPEQFTKFLKNVYYGRTMAGGGMAKGGAVGNYEEWEVVGMSPPLKYRAYKLMKDNYKITVIDDNHERKLGYTSNPHDFIKESVTPYKIRKLSGGSYAGGGNITEADETKDKETAISNFKEQIRKGEPMGVIQMYEDSARGWGATSIEIENARKQAKYAQGRKIKKMK